jgi:hypothetical protein
MDHSERMLRRGHAFRVFTVVRRFLCQIARWDLPFFSLQKKMVELIVIYGNVSLDWLFVNGLALCAESVAQ